MEQLRIKTGAVITAEKATELQSVEFERGQNFNPIELPDGRFYISLIEAQYLSPDDIVDLIEYEPIVEDDEGEDN